MRDDKRLIEDYLPIKEISGRALWEKSVRERRVETMYL